MRCVEISSSQEILYSDQRPRPSPGPSELLIRVRAVCLSHDISTLLSEFQSYPFIPGYEISGIVVETGKSVRGFLPGDEVVAILSDACGGCAEFAVAPIYCVVRKPPLISFEDAASVLIAGLRAYLANQYMLHIVAGESILIIDAAGSNYVATQLAGTMGARVIATVRSSEEISYLEDLPTRLVRIIDLSLAGASLVDTVLEETGGLGVDCILESTEKSFIMLRYDISIYTPPTIPSIASVDILACLSVGGRWVTSSPHLHIDPLDSAVLLLKSASLCYLNEMSWYLSGLQQGRLQHILFELMNKVRNDDIRAKTSKIFTLDHSVDAIRAVATTAVGKVVIKP